MVNGRIHDLFSDNQSRTQRKFGHNEDSFGFTTTQSRAILGLGALTLGLVIGVKALQKS
jgi:hypothetical protein